MNRLMNSLMYIHHSVFRCFSSRAAFSKLSVSIVYSVVLPVLMIYIKTVKNDWLRTIIAFVYKLVYSNVLITQHQD